MTTTAANTPKPSPSTNPQRASVPPSGPPPTGADGTPHSPEPSIGELLLDNVKDSAATVADTYLTTTGLRPAFETQRQLWQGAARVVDGAPVLDVIGDMVVPKGVRAAASFIAGIDTMKEGERIACSVEATGAIEGIALRREVEVSITKGVRGFEVALEDAGALGLIAAEDGHGGSVDAGAFEGVGRGMTIEVETLGEAKRLAAELALASNSSAGALIEGYRLTHPGLKEVELSADLVAEAGVSLESTAAEAGLEAAAGLGSSARFVAGDAPELVVSTGVALEGDADLSLLLGGANLGKSAGVEGKVSRELHFPLPKGTAAADLPALLAHGDAFAHQPRVSWALEATLQRLDGKQLVIEGTLRRGDDALEIEEGSVEWRSASGHHVGASEMHQSTGAEGSLTFERSIPLRREEFTNGAELGRALRSLHAEMTRAL
ncbi:MAG: hypothetical protein HYS27_19820 [Deltaproteobacteria bacterium]|nr:hypothetical protein [Deltaproteobacteria bacterium]